MRKELRGCETLSDIEDILGTKSHAFELRSEMITPRGYAKILKSRKYATVFEDVESCHVGCLSSEDFLAKYDREPSDLVDFLLAQSNEAGELAISDRTVVFYKRSCVFHADMSGDRIICVMGWVQCTYWDIAAGLDDRPAFKMQPLIDALGFFAEENGEGLESGREV